MKHDSGADPIVPDPTHRLGAFDQRLIRGLRGAIRFAVRILAVMMVAVIFWGVADVGYVLYERLVAPPMWLLSISDILATFGAFMAVLIAIEIFQNIILYLEDEILHIKIVLATALMAVARKVIILDFDETSPEYIFAVALVLAALGIVYWLLVARSGTRTSADWRPADAHSAPVPHPPPSERTE